MMSEASLFAGLECPECGRRAPAGLVGICECGSPMFARYEGTASPPAEGGLWSWRALLPPCDPVSLGEAETPDFEFQGALVKDEGRLPTGTFKARGAAVGVAMAKALGASGVALPSAGNAGVAWAAYCAKAGLRCTVFLPVSTPHEFVETTRLYGAEVFLEGEIIDDAGRAAKAFAEQNGLHFAATFAEPWRVEGKKTAFFEAARSRGWRMPDAIVFPVGGGVGLIAAGLAADQMTQLGWARGAPRLFAVQAEGCAPIVLAFERGLDAPESWPHPNTAAHGISIPNPFAGRLVLRALRETKGGAVAVGESEIGQAREDVARSTGVILVPEAAAAVAGYIRLRNRDAFSSGDDVLVYGTGSVR